MVMHWLWERLAAWSAFAPLVLVSVGAWFVVTFSNGFANKLGEEAATDIWRTVRARMVRRLEKSDRVATDGGVRGRPPGDPDADTG